ncbi:MAG TPA: DMT family transporter [Thermoanaerobaculia bacterium]|nr:DMT family transporter [Thermoanaerobaculia bacterium]
MSIFRRLRHAYRQAPGTLRGMLLIAAASFGFSVMHVLIRLLSSDLHPFEVAFFRNLFGVVVLLPVLARSGLGVLRTGRLPLHALRSALGLAAMLLFFTALSRTGLPKVTAMSFTAPLFATVGAVLVLREKIHLRRVAALLIGFLGTLIVMRPDAGIDSGVVMVLASSALWAIALLTIKALSHTESSFAVTLYTGLFMAPLSLVPASFVWSWPSGREYLWLALMGTIGTLSQLVMTQAFREADATAVLPVDFTRLLWASAFGVLVFGEAPELATLAGGTLIFVSTTYITYREAQVARASRREAAARAAAERATQPVPPP